RIASVSENGDHGCTSSGIIHNVGAGTKCYRKLSLSREQGLLHQEKAPMHKHHCGRVSSAPPFSSFKTNSLQSLHLLCVCWRYPELLSSSFVWSCSDEQTDVGASICRLETASHDSPVVGLVKRYQGVLRCSYT